MVSYSSGSSSGVDFSVSECGLIAQLSMRMSAWVVLA